MESYSKPAVKTAILLAVAVAGLIVIKTSGIGWLTPETIRNLIASFGWWGPIIYVLLFTIRPLFFLPAIIFTLAGGLAFGPWLGTLYVVIGSLTGACVCFGLTRMFGQNRFMKYWGKSRYLTELCECAAEHGFRTILVMRIAPIFPWDIVSFGAGLSKIRFGDFAVATAIGAVPGAFAYNFLFFSSPGNMSMFFVAAMMLALLMVTPYIYRFARR